MDQSRGEFVFDPEDFKEVAKSFEEESYRLPEEGLLEYAKLATKLRRQFTEKAEAARVRLAALLADGEEEKVIVEPKLYRSSFKKTVHKRPHDLMLGFEAQFACKKRKKRTKKELGIEELKEVLRLVKETGSSKQELAHYFNVKPHLVKNLVRNEKLGKNTVSRLETVAAAKLTRRNHIKDSVEEHLQAKRHVWTTQQIRGAVALSGGPDVKHEEVRQVLRQDFDMRFRVLKKAAYQGNSQRCLVTRMLYAKKMFSLLESGARIINIDESWLPYLDFRNKKWRAKNQPNTASTKALSPKVNMIAAIDTEGHLYLSLT